MNLITILTINSDPFFVNESEEVHKLFGTLYLLGIKRFRLYLVISI